MSIEKYRRKIDNIDEQIVKLIADRTRIAEAIGNVKRNAGLRVTDKDREAWVLAHIKQIAIRQNINSMDVEKIYRLIIDIAKRCEKLAGDNDEK